jgi:hypothetical protein
MQRNSYLLTCDIHSKRAIFCKQILEYVGFNVILVKCIPHPNKVLSNKLSMIHIFNLIKENKDEWGYIFEDDINLLKDIKLKEIIQYESISKYMFYLGCCVIYGANHYMRNSETIYENPVVMVNGMVRGAHAYALSKEGVDKLLSFLENYENYEYMDMILEKFTEIYPANVIQYNLESYIRGHRGIFFQDRIKFPSSI